MSSSTTKLLGVSDTVSARTTELFKEQQQSIIRHTDYLFSRLMIWQWLAAIGIALWLSPKAWSGANSQVHLHVWLAVFLGGSFRQPSLS